jgi:hypothetical protein
MLSLIPFQGISWFLVMDSFGNSIHGAAVPGDSSVRYLLLRLAILHHQTSIQ